MTRGRTEKKKSKGEVDVSYVGDALRASRMLSTHLPRATWKTMMIQIVKGYVSNNVLM